MCLGSLLCWGMNKTAGLDIVIYALMLIVPIATAALAAKFYGGLGILGGLLAAIFTYICFTSDTLILNTTYDQTAQAFVFTTYPMGFFAWIPLGLMVVNFIVAVKH